MKKLSMNLILVSFFISGGAQGLVQFHEPQGTPVFDKENPMSPPSVSQQSFYGVPQEEQQRTEKRKKVAKKLKEVKKSLEDAREFFRGNFILNTLIEPYYAYQIATKIGGFQSHINLADQRIKKANSVEKKLSIIWDQLSSPFASLSGASQGLNLLGTVSNIAGIATMIKVHKNYSGATTALKELAGDLEEKDISKKIKKASKLAETSLNQYWRLKLRALVTWIPDRICDSIISSVVSNTICCGMLQGLARRGLWYLFYTRPVLSQMDQSIKAVEKSLKALEAQ